MGKGYDSLEVIYTLLSYNEFKHQMILELKDNSNKALLIGDDFASVVLGSGCIAVSYTHLTLPTTSRV